MAQVKSYSMPLSKNQFRHTKSLGWIFVFFFSSVAVGANSFYRRIYANPDSNTIETVNFDIHRPSKSLAILLLYLRARLIPVTIAMLPTLPRELSIDDLAHPMDIPIYHYTHICVCVYIYIYRLRATSVSTCTTHLPKPLQRGKPSRKCEKSSTTESLKFFSCCLFAVYNYSVVRSSIRSLL